MYVCICTGVTDHDIRELKGQGVCSVEEIGRCSGAGTKCGACRSTIDAILEHGEAAPAPRSRRLRVLGDAAA